MVKKHQIAPFLNKAVGSDGLVDKTTPDWMLWMMRGTMRKWQNFTSTFWEINTVLYMNGSILILQKLI